MKDFIMGIDIGGTNIRCAVISKNKGMLSYKREEIINKNSKKSILKQLTNLIDKYVPSKISGIGIGVPAIVSLETGVLHGAYNLPGWKSVPLKKILEKRYKIPVLVNNDANCFALGVKYFGSAKNYDNIAGIILGTGFGAGLIIDNKLYCGNNCAAGEFGRIPLKDKTAEDYCSGKFFIDKYHLSGEKIYELAKKNDKKGLIAFRKFGENLGLGISMVINSIDPEIIVLGGSVSKAYTFFKKQFFGSLKKYTYKQVYKNIRIKVSKPEEIGALGAASLFLNR